MPAGIRTVFGSVVLIVAGILVLSRGLMGDEIEEFKRERDVNIQRASDHMRKCEMVSAADLTQRIELIESPLLFFGDPSRRHTNGTLWAFGKSGRPVAFLELFQGLEANSQWCHAVTLTGTDQVRLNTPVDTFWEPKKTQIEPQLIPDAPVPAGKESLRLRQLKQLSRRFMAHEFWDPDNSRFELRLLVQPIHRYQSPTLKIHDAAVFVMANGTNPEIVILIEALGDTLPNSRWHYSFAPMGSAEFHVELDGKPVWKRDRAPGVIGAPNDPYWLFVAPSD